MATQARAYRESGSPSSGNSAFDLVQEVADSNLPGDEQTVLRVTLQANRFAELGSTNELYVSKRTVALALEKPYIHVRRRFYRLVAKGVLVQIYGSNVYVKTSKGIELRRACTFQVDRTKLRRRKTVQEVVDERNGKKCVQPTHKRKQNTTHFSPSNEGPKQEVVTLQPADRSAERAQKRSQAIVGMVRHFALKGHTEAEAIRKTAVDLGLAREVVEADLKAMQFTFATDVNPKVSTRCARHPNSGLTERGTCWGCYEEQFSSAPPDTS